MFNNIFGGARSTTNAGNHLSADASTSHHHNQSSSCNSPTNSTRPDDLKEKAAAYQLTKHQSARSWESATTNNATTSAGAPSVMRSKSGSTHRLRRAPSLYVVNFLQESVPVVVQKLSQLAYLRHLHFELRTVHIGLVFVAVLIAAVTLQYSETLSNEMDLFLGIVLLLDVAISEVLVWFRYRMKLKRRMLTDNFFGSTEVSVVRSPLAVSYLRESFVLLLHCPPGLIRLNHSLVYLNVLVFVRVVYILPVLKDRSRLNTFLGRVLARLAHVPFTTSLILRTQLHFHPISLVATFYIISWLTLSLFVFNAEGWSFGEALWCMFTTSTTVGYGDIAPKTLLGRCVAGVMSLCGLVCTSLFIAIISQRIALTDKQRRVVTIVAHHERVTNLRRAAAITLQCAWRHYADITSNRKMIAAGGRGDIFSYFFSSWRRLHLRRMLILAAHDLRAAREKMYGEDYIAEDATLGDHECNAALLRERQGQKGDDDDDGEEQPLPDDYEDISFTQTINSGVGGDVAPVSPTGQNATAMRSRARARRSTLFTGSTLRYGLHASPLLKDENVFNATTTTLASRGPLQSFQSLRGIPRTFSKPNAKAAAAGDGGAETRERVVFAEGNGAAKIESVERRLDMLEDSVYQILELCRDINNNNNNNN
eukprot:PhM_4_TR8345/c2_g1_i1/m.17831